MSEASILTISNYIISPYNYSGNAEYVKYSRNPNFNFNDWFLNDL